MKTIRYSKDTRKLATKDKKLFESTEWFNIQGLLNAGFVEMAPLQDIRKNTKVGKHLSLVFMLNGAVHHHIHGSKSVVSYQPNKVYLSYSHDTIYGTDFFPANYSYNIILLQFRPDELLKIFNECPLNSYRANMQFSSPNFCIWRLTLTPVLKDIAQRLQAARRSSDALSQLNIQRLSLNALWLTLEQLKCSSSTDGEPIKSSLTGRDRKNVINAQLFIHEHFQTHLIIKDIAKVIGVSESKLNRNFKKVFDVGIHRYIINYRLQQVTKLLNESTLTVSDIAIRCGFTCAGHLSRRFVEVFGVTPHAYRCN